MDSRETEGLKHIHNLMHVLIEGIAAGVYTSIDDAQRDAQEYLTMEKAIKKLSNWNESSSIEELANIFDGISNSKKVKEEEREREEVWAEITSMLTLPKLFCYVNFKLY